MTTPLIRTILERFNLCSDTHKQYKLKLLNKFIEANKHLAPQGSVEWLIERGYSIGGSEMSIITKENPYQKIDGLVQIKL